DHRGHGGDDRRLGHRQVFHLAGAQRQGEADVADGAETHGDKADQAGARQRFARGDGGGHGVSLSKRSCLSDKQARHAWRWRQATFTYRLAALSSPSQRRLGERRRAPYLCRPPLPARVEVRAMTQAPALPVNAIEVRGLKKTYKGSRKSPPKTALRGVDLTVPRGSMFGLLGPNGAGKSTLINIIAGVVNKSEGTVRIWDRDIDHEARDARSALGVVPQEIVADVFFTP